MLNHKFKKTTDLMNHLNINASHLFHREVDREWCFNDYCHNFNRVYIVLNGSGRLFNDHEDITMLPGNVYIIPANHTFSCACDNYMEKIFIHFTATIIPQKDILSNVKRFITFKIGEDETKKICDTLYCENICSALFIQSYICSLILKIAAPFAADIENDILVYHRYEDLYRYITDNLSAKLTVSEVCKHIGFSQTYIGRRFREDTGITIKKYISNSITDRLKYYLLFTSLSVSDIADRLQFESESYCSKFFKKQMCISPTAYRKIHNSVQR